MFQQWRHLKQLKRSGRGHDATGVAGTKLGECALLCPACPHPDINLPANWMDEKENMCVQPAPIYLWSLIDWLTGGYTHYFLASTEISG